MREKKGPKETVFNGTQMTQKTQKTQIFIFR